MVGRKQSREKGYYATHAADNRESEAIRRAIDRDQALRRGLSRREGASIKHAEIRRLLLRTVIVLAVLFVIPYMARGLDAGVFFVLDWVLMVPYAVVVYWTFCFFWIGFDEPFSQQTLRIAGVLAGAEVVFSVLYLLILAIFPPAIVFAWIGFVVAATALLMDKLEIEPTEGLALAMACMLWKAGMWFWVISAILG